MVSRMTQNHASANAFWNHVRRGSARYAIVTQQSVHPTLGSLRVFKRFLPLSLVQIGRRAAVRPSAGNANRWAVDEMISNR